MNKNSRRYWSITIGLSLLAILALLITLVAIIPLYEEPNWVSFFLLVTNIVAITTAIMFYYFWRRKVYLVTNDFSLSSSEVLQVSERGLNRGILNYDFEGKIIYISRWLLETGFKKYLGKPLESIGLNMHNTSIQEIVIEDKFYKFIFYYKTRTIIVIDITEQEQLKNYIVSKQPAIIIIKKTISRISSNKDELLYLKLNLQINEIIEKWAFRKKAIVRIGESTSQNILILAKWSIIKKSLYEEEILQKVKEILPLYFENISIEIGVSYGNSEFVDLFDEANNALMIATNRGGNQTVISSDNEEKLKYIGASRLSEQEDSKVEISLFANRLKQSMSFHKEVFITSHHEADIDAFSSSVLMALWLQKLNIDSYIILPNLDSFSESEFKKLSKENRDLFITEEEAFEKRTRLSGLIVVDVSDKKRIQAPKFIEKINEDSIYLIDHHRMDHDAIISNQNSVNVYVDHTASSVSFLLTELLFALNDEDLIDKKVASLLLAGIYVDTNELTRNTSARTYEVIASLVKKGASVPEVSNNVKISTNIIPLLQKVLDNMVYIKKNVVLSALPENIILDELHISNLANLFLQYKDIDAGFVLGKTRNKTYKLSARSNNNFNVQIVTKMLGGGGHFNASAAVWDKNEISYSEVQRKIKTAILNSQKKNVVTKVNVSKTSKKQKKVKNG